MNRASAKGPVDMLRSCLSAAVLLACLGAANAQDGASPAMAVDPRRSEYDAVSREIELSAARVASLTAEIAQVKQDSTSITAAAIQAAKTERKLSQDIDDIAEKLDGLKAQQTTVRASLAARSAVLAEVLGALQRMGLNPPPAILVKPEDALSSVRSAILLGAVVPELREETEILMADMAELNRIAATIEAERDRLAASMTDQLAEKKRLALLLDAKQRIQSQAETQLIEERQRSEALAAKAGSLRELIAALDVQAARDRSALEAARAAKAAILEKDEAIAALPDNNRNIDVLPFDALEGQLQVPVNGRFSRRFGGKDDNGGVMLGDTLATQSGAIVTAPADGNVLYAGPFRSYGQLLILDAGGGYHVVLAGLSRISVALGRSVLAGEPVGAMAEARIASTASGVPAGSPELYVEFRKDGKPVDPAPWWAGRRSGRTGNDS